MLGPRITGFVLLVVAVLLGVQGPASQAETTSQPTSNETVVIVKAGDASQRQRVAEAVGRFETHRLPLPDVQIWFHDDEAGCDGHLGLFRQSTAPWTIDICSDLEFVVTHELAHAFIELTFDDVDRAAYVEAQDLPTWNDRAVEWRRRGVEDAAFVIQQNLTAKPWYGQLSEEWERRAAAYEMATGLRSPLRS